MNLENRIIAVLTKYYIFIHSGGELLDRILALGKLSESEAWAIMKTVTAAVSYLHMHGVVHRFVQLLQNRYYYFFFSNN